MSALDLCIHAAVQWLKEKGGAHKGGQSRRCTLAVHCRWCVNGKSAAQSRPSSGLARAARQVLAWVEQFCAKTKATGQLCFDFMLNDADGRLYAFECNPRTSTVLLEYHDHPLFAEALCNPQVPCRDPCGLRCSTLVTLWCCACALHASHYMHAVLLHASKHTGPLQTIACFLPVLGA